MKDLLGDLEEKMFPTIIGHDQDGEPIWCLFGAKPKDDDDDDDDDSDDDDDDDDSDDDDDDDDSDDDDSDDDSDDDDDDEDDKKSKSKRPSPKPKRDPHKKGPNYDITVKRERMARKKAERQLAALRKQHESEAEKAAREAQEAAEKKYRPIAIRSAASSALQSAGAKSKDVSRLSKLIDTDELDINDDNEVVGLDEQVDLLKQEYPELFGITEDDDDDDDDDDEDTRPRRRPAKKSVSKADGAGRRPAKKKEPKTSAERLAAQAHASR